MDDHNNPRKPIEEDPPIFRSWTHWYLLVIGTLVLCIAIFYWITIYYR